MEEPLYKPQFSCLFLINPLSLSVQGKCHPWTEFFPGVAAMPTSPFILLSFYANSSVQSLSHVQLSATPWTAACQASLSFTNSWSLLKLMYIESVMPSNHLILYHPLLLMPSLFPASGSFPVSQFFASSGQSIGASASALAFPMNIQD